MTLRLALLTVCAAGLVAFPQTLFAQSATETKPHVPLEKSIGQAKPEVVPSLFVLNSRGASLKDGKLVLVGISPNAIVFADRPVRAAGHDLTSRIVEDWGNGSDNFASDPPNATVSGFKKDGSSVVDAVVVLKSPKLEGDKLTFDVAVLEGDLAGADGPASVLSTSLADLSRRCPLPASHAGPLGAVPSIAPPPMRERRPRWELPPILTMRPGADIIPIPLAIRPSSKASSRLPGVLGDRSQT